MNVQLLIIDPQEDFCNKNTGSLFVPRADEDMKRVANLIRKLKHKIDDIHVTLDSHHKFSIFHPAFIVDRHGKNPVVRNGLDAFHIPHQSILAGDWRASNQVFQKYLEKYTFKLEEIGKYPYMMWPYHCLIGYPGSNIYGPVGEALLEWEELPAMVDTVTKGSHFLTEHYSAVKAVLEDPSIFMPGLKQDPSTMLNTALIDAIEKPDLITLVMGEAGSHCVPYTLRDIVENFGSDAAKNIIILEDCTSPVPGYEKDYEDFKVEMVAKGIQFMTSTQFIS